MLASHYEDLIGHTPIIELTHIEKEFGLKARIYAKVEYFNPTGSVKDRAAIHMVRDQEVCGGLKEGGTIIEPTSGNTGIGLAALAANRGYRLILTMPESMSEERRKLLRIYGAEIVLTPASEGMNGAVEEAKRLHASIPNSIILNQFMNLSNPSAHYWGTGPEIYEDLNGNLDIFVAGIGTGGTISGTGAYLKDEKPTIRVIGVEPASSPMITEGVAGPHKIQGIGANFIPEVLNSDVIDDMIVCSDEDAFTYAKLVAKKEGLLVGISSGAALYGAVSLAKLEENEGKTIVVLFPDSGDRYLSTPLFD